MSRLPVLFREPDSLTASADKKRNPEHLDICWSKPPPPRADAGCAMILGLASFSAWPRFLSRVGV